MVSVWFLGGANLFFIGLVGLYISRIFSEVKQRPNTIVRASYGDLKRAPWAEETATAEVNFIESIRDRR